MSIGFNSNPFQRMIEEFSKSIIYTPVVKTTNNISGDEKITKGTPITIQAAFYKRDQTYSQTFEALFEDADAILIMLPSIEIVKNGFVEYDSEKYQNRDGLFKRKLGTNHFYNYARLYLHERG